MCEGERQVGFGVHVVKRTWLGKGNGGAHRCRGDGLPSVQRVKACCMIGLNRLMSASGRRVDDVRGCVCRVAETMAEWFMQ